MVNKIKRFGQAEKHSYGRLATFQSVHNYIRLTTVSIVNRPIRTPNWLSEIWLCLVKKFGNLIRKRFKIFWGKLLECGTCHFMDHLILSVEILWGEEELCRGCWICYNKSVRATGMLFLFIQKGNEVYRCCIR